MSIEKEFEDDTPQDVAIVYFMDRSSLFSKKDANAIRVTCVCSKCGHSWTNVPAYSQTFKSEEGDT